jgi:hypothetical protein
MSCKFVSVQLRSCDGWRWHGMPCYTFLALWSLVIMHLLSSLYVHHAVMQFDVSVFTCHKDWLLAGNMAASLMHVLEKQGGCAGTSSVPVLFLTT